MKRFALIIFLFQSFSLSAQTDKAFMHEYKKRNCALAYSYIQKGDSLLIYGHVEDRRTSGPVVGMNIVVMGFPIGTVSDPGGNFKLLLPRQQGTLIFDKTGFGSFEFPFRFKKDDLKRPSAHH